MNVDGLVEKKSSHSAEIYRVKYYENSEGGMVAKVCRQCEVTKPLVEFSKQKTGLGGRLSQCKPCEAKRKAKHYEGNKESAAEYHRKYYEENRSRILAVDRTYREENKERRLETLRNWAGNNKDKLRVQKQRRRAREKALPEDFTLEQMEETIGYFGGCAITGDSIDIHWDHVIPLATGHGGTTSSNMVPLRADLNLSKNDANIFEWFSANQQRFNLEQERLDRLISWLASANAMSVEEYRAYVYECHANPNEIETKEAN